MIGIVFKGKISEWVRRYLPAEIVATVGALATAFVGHQLSGSLIIAAIAGTVGENVGYYGYFAIKEVSRHFAAHHGHSASRRWFLTGYKTVRDMMIEFGLAETLDSFVFRPLFMYLGPLLLGQFALGIFVGKLAADVVFYTFAVAGYELRKRWR